MHGGMGAIGFVILDIVICKKREGKKYRGLATLPDYFSPFNFIELTIRRYDRYI
jgi:hypothetical protein